MPLSSHAHPFLPALVLLTAAPALAQPVLTPKHRFLYSEQATELTVTDAVSAAGWRWEVASPMGGSVLPEGPDKAVFCAPLVPVDRHIRVRAISRDHPGLSAECVIQVAPLDEGMFSFGLDPPGEGFSGAFPFLNLEDGQRFGDGIPVRPWKSEAWEGLHIPEEVAGYGQPFRLTWPAGPTAAHQLLTFGAAEQFTRLDVTHRSTVIIRCTDRVAQAAVEYLAEDKAGHWMADSLPIHLQVRGVVPLAGNWVAAPGHLDGMGVSARFTEPFGMELVPIGFDPVAQPEERFLCVADVGDQTLRVVTPDGRVRSLCGQSRTPGEGSGSWAKAQFRNPTFLAAEVRHDPPGWTVYVADSGNHRIQRVRSDGTVDTLAGVAGQPGYQETAPGQPALFRLPQGLALDDHYLYVADQGNRVVRRIDTRTGETTLVAGIPPTADDAGPRERFSLLWGLALGQYSPPGHLDGLRVLFVADGNAIRQINLADGAVTTLAGSVREAAAAGGDLIPAPGQRPDWLAGRACFDGPAGLLWERDCSSLLIADRRNGAVRRLYPATGRLNTVAGGPERREVRFGLLRDGLSGLPDGYAALPGLKGLARGFTPGEWVASLGSCLAQVGIGRHLAANGLRHEIYPLLRGAVDIQPSTLAPTTEAKAEPGPAAGARTVVKGAECLYLFVPEAPRLPSGVTAPLRPMTYTVEIQAPGVRPKTRSGRGQEETTVFLPVTFLNTGQGLIRVRWVNDQGYTGQGEDLPIQVVEPKAAP